MSLRVWLPLTKDLRNQGLDDVTVTNNGVTFNSAGKLGGCYYFNGSGYLKETSFDWTNFDTSEFSLCCWYKEPSPVASGNSQMVCIGTSSGWNNIRIGLLRRTSNGYPMFSVSDGTNNVNYSFTADSFTLDTWNHIVCTYNNGTMKMYLNGILHKTYTTTITPLLNSSQHLGVGAASNGSEPLVGYLNDVRIYDHCLSPMEVKELSKGLVLHYPLNRGGWGQENLASQYIMPGGNKPGTTATDGRTNYYGDYGISIPATENADTYFSIWYSEPLESGATYTLSAEVSGLLSGSYYNFHLFAQDNTSMGIIKFNHNGLNTFTFTMNYTGTITTTTYNGKTYYRMFMDDVGRTIASGQGAITIKNIKLEKGDKATPWCPNSSDALATSIGLNGTTEYDTSGYCNNGVRTGTFSWTSDTPKYQVSQYFNNPTGTSTLSDKIYISASPNLYSPSAITVGFWFKKEAITRGGLFTTGLATTSTTTLAIHDYDSSVKVISSDNTTLSMGSYDTFIPSTNIWYHYVITFDGINAKIYINGDLKTTKSYSGTKTLQNIIDITLGVNSAGGVYRSAKGYYSDFRIYTTALSADDVKSLYQNSAYIDSSGNVYGTIHES